MGIFLLPTSIINRLNQLIRKFWWGYNEDTSKIQWVRWNQLSYSKEAGGLGFRDFRSFNLALLAKQGWRILQNPSSLAAMVLKQKYFPKTSFLDATLGARPSFAWRGVCAGLEILREGLVWRVGSGHNINIWKDWWLTSFPSKRVVSTRPVGCECEKELFTVQEYEAVKAIPISAGGGEDRMIWHFSTNGQYSVKSGYHVHRQMEADFQGESSKKTQAIEEVSIFRESLVTDKGTRKQAGSAGLRWAKPMQNSYKLNWDATIRAKEGRVGIGVIVRDYQGQVVGTVRAQRPLRGTPFDGEAYGLLVAAEFSRDLGLQQVCLEGDAKRVVDGLQSKAMDWSLGGCLIEDAKRVLDSSVDWTASHVHREANMAAHQLAKVATEMVEDVYDVERCPSCVFHIVHREMM
ncbi:uncharacterized protein LOC122293615 [Carya illinoinensis]|uniref:uncharacterized protein LOC122293615 n=1 Tax=Carya illinoinensis TaxID=32201 RepID=UPI001C727330|nr:uncharacterized protein LOC122293615 [Carya illinoinensis]